MSCAGLLLFDPLNIFTSRINATDSTNMLLAKGVEILDGQDLDRPHENAARYALLTRQPKKPCMRACRGMD